jgi:hypothetical protein
MSRAQWTRAFLWISVLTWGIGLGAKIFDLLVVAGAWTASPPASFSLYPYGHSFPINPGDFFQPLSALILIGSLGALLCGWKTPIHYRFWLWLSVLAFVIIWIFTPTVFWPLISTIYAVANGKITKTDAESIALAHRWIVVDSLRVVVIAIGFISSIQSISMPYVRTPSTNSSHLP